MTVPKAPFPVLLSRGEFKDIWARAREAEVEETRAALRERLAAYKAAKRPTARLSRSTPSV
jgi:hypothetical protein